MMELMQAVFMPKKTNQDRGGDPAFLPVLTLWIDEYHKSWSIGLECRLKSEILEEIEENKNGTHKVSPDLAMSVLVKLMNDVPSNGTWDPVLLEMAFDYTNQHKNVPAFSARSVVWIARPTTAIELSGVLEKLEKLGINVVS